MCDKKGIILMETLLFLIILSVCVLLVTTVIGVYYDQQMLDQDPEEAFREAYQMP